MAPDTAATTGGDGDCEVMAAIEDSADRFVIADLCRDEAWLAASLSGAVSLEEYR